MLLNDLRERACDGTRTSVKACIRIALHCIPARALVRVRVAVRVRVRGTARQVGLATED